MNLLTLPTKPILYSEHFFGPQKLVIMNWIDHHNLFSVPIIVNKKATPDETALNVMFLKKLYKTKINGN